MPVQQRKKQFRAEIGGGDAIQDSQKRRIIRKVRSHIANNGGTGSVYMIRDTPDFVRVLIYQCHAVERGGKTKSGLFRVQVDEL